MERKQGEKNVKKKNFFKEKSIKRYLCLTQLTFKTTKTPQRAAIPTSGFTICNSKHLKKGEQLCSPCANYWLKII